MTEKEKDLFIKLLEEEVHQSSDAEGVFFSNMENRKKMLEFLVRYNPERWKNCYEYNLNKG